MNRTTIRSLLEREGSSLQVETQGWLRTRRETKSVVFVELNDGSCRSNLQIVIDKFRLEQTARSRICQKIK